MKTRIVFMAWASSVFLSGSLFSAALGAEVYKCVEKGKVMYSNARCPEGAVSTVVPDFSGAGSGTEGVSPPSAPKEALPKAAPAPFPDVALPGNVPPGMMEALKKQVELLMRQREPANPAREDKDNALEGY